VWKKKGGTGLETMGQLPPHSIEILRETKNLTRGYMTVQKQRQTVKC
jgi:hypothetical protein